MVPITDNDTSLQEPAALMPIVRAVRTVTTTTANVTNLSNARSARAHAPTDTHRQAASWAGSVGNVSPFCQSSLSTFVII